jgi:hypothetical protein
MLPGIEGMLVRLMSGALTAAASVTFRLTR